jgi:hypothetical protein
MATVEGYEHSDVCIECLQSLRPQAVMAMRDWVQRHGFTDFDERDVVWEEDRHVFAVLLPLTGVSGVVQLEAKARECSADGDHVHVWVGEMYTYLMGGGGHVD